jgi:hypothetical protein
MNVKSLFSLLLSLTLYANVSVAAPVDNHGAILSGTTDLYLITVGNWSGATQATDLNYTQYLAQNLGSSSWWNVTNEFMRGGTSTLNYKGTLNDASVTTGNLSEAAIRNIVNAEKTANSISDPNAVFMVLFGTGLTAADGLANNYCGEHYFTPAGGNYFGWVDVYSGLNCHYSSGPFANVENTPSVLAHEILEVVTDPTGHAWWDSVAASPTHNDETGDMCSWTSPLGTQLTQIGSIGMRIQETWDNTAQMCVAGRDANGGIITAGVNLSTALPTPPPVSVPEPESLLLVGLSLGVMALRRRAVMVPVRS